MSPSANTVLALALCSALLFQISASPIPEDVFISVPVVNVSHADATDGDVPTGTITTPALIAYNITNPVGDSPTTQTSKSNTSTTTTPAILPTTANEPPAVTGVDEKNTTPAPCPMECECAPNLLDAICTQQDLLDIPSGLHPRVRMLILSSNNITAIGENTFKERNLYDLMSVLINHNAIQHIDSNAFAILKRLEVLDLGDNKLDKLDPSLFENNSVLITLRIDNNMNLELPEEGPFIISEGLRELNMSSCNISTLPKDVFSGTPSLDTIDLRKNNLQDIDVEVFKNLTSLTKLILPDTLRNQVSAICGINEHLTEILLSNNGNEENVPCKQPEKSLKMIIQFDKTSASIETTITPITPHTAHDSVEKTLENDQNVNLYGGEAKNIDSEIPVPAEAEKSKAIVEPQQTGSIVSVKQQEMPNVEPSSGLNGAQIDNIIIGVILTALIVCGVVITVKLNKDKLGKMFKTQQRRPRPIPEPEGEPLRNMVSNRD